jgi:RHS repeat-associated protein
MGRSALGSRRLGLAAVLAVLAQGLYAAPPAVAAGSVAGRVWTPPNTRVSTVAAVPGSYLHPAGSAATQDHGGRPYRAPKVTLPAAGSVDVHLGYTSAPASAGAATPVYVGAATAGSPTTVHVDYADRATALQAGVDGLLLSVSRADGSAAAGRVAVEVDPAALAGLYGGNFAQRLALFEVPACALTTPRAAACQARTPVPVTRDAASGRLVANVALPARTAAGTGTSGAVALAAASVPAGSAGTYAATSVRTSDQWSAGGSTGDFTYSYPITPPASLGGTAPAVTLSYASSAEDGLTVSSNAQSSAFGDGWSYSPGFIERTYQPCALDGISGSGDTCWAYQGHEVTASGSGIAGQVVWDDGSQSWRMGGSGAKVELLSGAGNGAYDGEYWLVTTTDGTRYYYGAGTLPSAEGGRGTDVATNGAWTEPVYCPSSGDGPSYPTFPSCHSATAGTASFATNMAYRWNLDHVVDAHGNATVYTYATETNEYARAYVQNNGTGVLTPYVRGGYLTQISYGWLASDVAAEAGAPAPAARVVFHPTERCTVSTTTCQSSNLSSSTASNWPDVPYDQSCSAGSTTCRVASETYWSTRRIDQVQTQVNAGTTGSPSYQPVDTYALSQSFPDPGDGTSPALRLDSITRTGSDASAGVTGGGVSLPAVSFLYATMPNRVPGSLSWPAFNRFRITGIDTETGGVVNVAYSAPDCGQSATAPDLPAPANDTRLCYQAYWTPAGGSLTADWFEKYVVTQVAQSDPTGGSPEQLTRYQYAGSPAWHRDDSPFVPNSQRTWDQFRGFGQVIARTGTTPEPVTETETTFLRGMDGDSTSTTGGSPRSVTVTTTMGDTVTDSNQHAGQTLETQTFSADGGQSQVESESLPWSTQVGSHAEPTPAGIPAETAFFTGTAVARTRTLLSSGAWRATRTVNAYSPATGLLTQVDDQGDLSQVGTATSQETCTTLTYAAAPAGNPMMTTYPARTTKVFVTAAGPVGTATCPALSPANAVSDTVDYYDGSAAAGAIGAAGNVTMQRNIDAWSASAESSQTAQSANAFDVYGRLTSTTSALGDVTTTALTPAAGTLPTTIATTDATMGWTTTTTLSRARQLPTRVVDQNGNTTSERYDALGRLLDVWLPGRGTLQSASRQYVYSVNGGASPTWVASLSLLDDGSYTTDYSIYDGFMQLRQRQTSALGGSAGGSLVVDTFRDSHGWVVRTSSPYYVSANPSNTLYGAADANVPGQTVTTYDGRGRPIASAFTSYANEQWRTTTSYPGEDRVDVTPPAGGTPTSTFTDAQGRTSATWSFNAGAGPNDAETYAAGAAAPGDATQVSYRYANVAGGSQTTVTDSAGHVWSHRLDYHGHQTASTDPNSGSASATYDAAGDLLTATTNAGARTLVYRYDTLGRKLDARAGSSTGALVGQWTYDTASGGRGHLASSVSYDGTGNAYTQTIAGYTNQYAPTGVSVTIPRTSAADEAKLAGTYSESMTYTAIAGLPSTISYGADGGLPAETVTDRYTSMGALVNVAGAANYLTSAVIDQFGRTAVSTMGDEPRQVVATSNFDNTTGRVVESVLDVENGTAHIDDITNTWSPAGRITSTKDVQNGTATDLQCYTYNTLGQLATAWTDTAGTTAAAPPSVLSIGGCATSSPSAGTIGGPAAYWQSYTYDAAGDRSGQIDHDLTGATGRDVVRTYAYPLGGAPNELAGVTASSGGTISGQDSYSYNADGSVRTRVLASGANQTLAYDAGGRTQSVTDAATGNAAAYRYDADGGLLVERDTTAGVTTVTVHLPGEQLTLNTSTQTETGLRSYATGAIREVRSSSGALTYEYGDSQGTETVSLDAATLTATRRSFTPYGAPRGVRPASWVDNRGFLNQPADPGVGLSLLGARLYDPGTGRFLQRDPVLEAGDPQQLGGYAYAGNDPVNRSDPSGLSACIMVDRDFCAGRGPGGGGGGSGSTGSAGGGSGSGGGGGGGGSTTYTYTGSGTADITTTGMTADHNSCRGFIGPVAAGARCGTATASYTAPSFIDVNGGECHTSQCQAEADAHFQQIAVLASGCSNQGCVDAVMKQAEQPEQRSISDANQYKALGLQPPKPRCTGFWGCLWHDTKAVTHAVGTGLEWAGKGLAYAAPVIDIATIFVPELAPLAFLANTLSAGNSAVSFGQDIAQHKSGTQTFMDGTSMTLSVAGFGAFSKVSKAAQAADSADAAYATATNRAINSLKRGPYGARAIRVNAIPGAADAYDSAMNNLITLQGQAFVFGLGSNYFSMADNGCSLAGGC